MSEVMRVDVPLRMIDGNIDLLLEQKIPCIGISFRWAEDTAVPTLILVISATDEQQEIFKEMGFKTQKLGKE